MTRHYDFYAVRAKVVSNRAHYSRLGESRMVEACDLTFALMDVAEAAHKLTAGTWQDDPGQLTAALDRFDFGS
jgi:hypothetical protein